MKHMTRSEVAAHNRKANNYHDLFEIIKIVFALASIISIWFVVMSIEANAVSVGWIISSVICCTICGISEYLYQVSDNEVIKVEIKEDE